jgi:hypothetical protein
MKPIQLVVNGVKLHARLAHPQFVNEMHDFEVAPVSS